VSCWANAVSGKAPTDTRSSRSGSRRDIRMAGLQWYESTVNWRRRP
jgi:hypothetical protein